MVVLSHFCCTFFQKKHRKIIRFRGKNEDVTAPPKSSLSHRHIDAILTPSKLVSERLSSLQKPVHSVVLGLDTKRFSLNSDAFARSPRPSLCIVGRFDPVKGHKTFLKTFARLIDLWDEPYDLPVLKIIGEPANLSAEDLKCEAERLGLLDRGVLTIIDARVPDIASHMRSCHLGVVSSEGSEVICRVAEEFLLSGTQIAVSGVGSLRECLFDEAAGFSFHDLQGDKLVKKLKNQLVKAYEEPFDMRLKRAQKARELFSYEAMGQGLLTLFDQLNN
jgi:glycosyltransferase involved in cell wall biosynthesis